MKIQTAPRPAASALAPQSASGALLPAPSSASNAQSAARSGCSPFELRRGGAMPAGAPRTPASAFAQQYGHTLLSLPGAYTVGWGHPGNEVFIWMDSERSAAVLSGLLEQQIGEVKLVVGISATRQPYSGSIEVPATERARAVAAMPGVWDFRHSGSNVAGTVTFRTINQATIDALDPIIRDSYTWGQTKGGHTRIMRVRWVPGIPAASR